MTLLPDVNVLVAIAWPEHVLHAAAVTWFDDHADEGWATCAISELGFLRISANAAVVTDPVAPWMAAQLLTELKAVGEHRFWSDDLVPSELAAPLDRIHGHRQVTDAHLIGLARRHGGRVATFDRGLSLLGGPDAVELLTAGG